MNATYSAIGGLALRLVSVIGLATSVIVLSWFWQSQTPEEHMVSLCAIYYFAGTAYVSAFVQNQVLVVGAATFLNSLLLILAFGWDRDALPGEPAPLMVASIVFGILWLLFIGFRPGTMRRRMLRPFHS
jgi:hypothetical protein